MDQRPWMGEMRVTLSETRRAVFLMEAQNASRLPRVTGRTHLPVTEQEREHLRLARAAAEAMAAFPSDGDTSHEGWRREVDRQRASLQASGVRASWAWGPVRGVPFSDGIDWLADDAPDRLRTRREGLASGRVRRGVVRSRRGERSGSHTAPPQARRPRHPLYRLVAPLHRWLSR